MAKLKKKHIRHTINVLKKLVDGYRLVHGYKITKRKKRHGKKEYKLF